MTTSRVDNHVPREPPPDEMLRRRVLPIDEYIAELREDKKEIAERLKRQLQVRRVPIPVPLRPGETEDQYERRFRESGGKFETLTGEWASRFVFAKQAAEAYKAEMALTMDDPPRSGDEEADRVRNTKRFIELDQFRREIKTGVYGAYQAMTKAEKRKRFGIPMVPIFVPLARGETAQQYEDRFVDWLASEHETTLAQVCAHRHRGKERELRMRFALLNGRGELAFDPSRFPKRKTVEAITSKATKKPRIQKEQLGHVCRVNGKGSLDAWLTCRCDACLLCAMKVYRESICSIEKQGRREERPTTQAVASPLQDVVVVDLTGEDTTHSNNDHHRKNPQLQKRDLMEKPRELALDPVETRLQHEFDTINEQIVLNQEVLEEAEAQLVNGQVEDLDELVRLHCENEEMRALIQAEFGNRTTALALLILYQWRHDAQDLERLLHSPSTSNVDHVQRGSYRQCMTLSNELSEARRQCAVLERELNDGNDTTAETTTQLKEKLRQIRNRIGQLVSLRRQEYVLVVQFDQQLRRVVRELLTSMKRT